jgi:hypothetical protein
MGANSLKNAVFQNSLPSGGVISGKALNFSANILMSFSGSTIYILIINTPRILILYDTFKKIK